MRSQAKALGIDLSDYAKYDLHIHVPAGGGCGEEGNGDERTNLSSS